jgi:hypothetical protein
MSDVVSNHDARVGLYHIVCLLKPVEEPILPHEASLCDILRRHLLGRYLLGL